MFRIKTDIRQYKCESREKVERLIRNWVVRPTDLIFDQDEQAWAPIGEHSIFAQTFAEMANREQMGADTVVSPHPPEAMDEEEPAEGAEGEAAEKQDEPEQPEEQQEEQEADASEEGGGAAEVEDEPDPPDPPEPPEGIQQEAERDDEEITLMTERSFDEILEDEELDGEGATEDLRQTDETAGASVAEGGGAGGAVVEAQEPESIRETVEDTRPRAERPEGATTEKMGAVEADAEVVAERTREAESPTVELEPDEELGTTTEDEVDVPTAELERGDAADSSEFVESADSGEFETETPTGRHDLPEDIFATNEIAGSLKRQDVETIDELGEEDEEGEAQEAGGETAPSEEDYDVQEVEEALQRERQQRVQQRDDDEWNEILERLRETDELSKAEIEEITRTTDQISIGRDEAEDGEAPEDAEEYVSEGYSKALPIRIGPTREDIRLGLRPSKASTADKDRIFPYPEPKRKGEVQERVFRLRPPADHSLKFILGGIGVLLVMIVTAVVIF